MLKRCDIVFSKEYNDEINFNFGSVLQGYIMEHIGEYADVLHSVKLNPYSQYVFFSPKDEAYVWRLHTLTEEAEERLAKPIKESIKNGVELKHKGKAYRFDFVRDYSPVNDEDLISLAYKGDVKEYVTMKFITPCSFHSYGKNVFYPDGNLLIKSMMNRANAYLPVEVSSEEVLKQLSDMLNVRDYSLKSTTFFIEKVRLKSFTGTATFYVKGPEMMKRLFYMLASYAQYSGVGVKTAMGMGGIILL